LIDYDLDIEFILNFFAEGTNPRLDSRQTGYYYCKAADIWGCFKPGRVLEQAQSSIFEGFVPRLFD
jgi:hypothetical protein